MNQALLFKILQRQNKFRNPKSLISIPSDFSFSAEESSQASKYLEVLQSKKIKLTYPGDAHYPSAFLKTLEPPLFLEYIGEPVWDSVKKSQGPQSFQQKAMISVVGSRKIHPLSVSWMKSELAALLEKTETIVVSGGAIGVDLLAHSVAVASGKPTVAILPSGLSQLQPLDLKRIAPALLDAGGVLVSEFEHQMLPRKDYYFFRNRLIAAMGAITLIVQAQKRSGTFLTVHHALQNGRPIMVVPSHPELEPFSGNLMLLQDGALPAYNHDDIQLYLQTETQFGAEPHQLFSV